MYSIMSTKNMQQKYNIIIIIIIQQFISATLLTIKLLINAGSMSISVRATGAPLTPDSGKAIIFQAKATFIRQKPTTKNEKNVLIKQKNGIHSV